MRARLIQHEQIARVEIIRHIAEDAMLKFSTLTMQHQQARRITRLSRRLRDGGFGEVVVEVGGFQCQKLLPKP